jgi:predicted DNA-binding protein (MmcQ/YjbR family)
MGLDTIRTFCRSLPAVTEDIKWEHNLAFSVGGKMFALQSLEPPRPLWFKCDPEQFAELTERDGIIPAPYLARAGWVAIESIDNGPEWAELQPWLRHAYDLVRAKLPKKVQAELDGVAHRRRR